MLYVICYTYMLNHNNRLSLLLSSYEKKSEKTKHIIDTTR